MPLYITSDKVNEIDTEVIVCPYGLEDKDFKAIQDEIYQLAGYDRLTRSVQQKKTDTSVFMTPSFNLNKDYICHVLFGKKSILHYYKMCIEIAKQYQCTKIAFPVYDVSEIDKLVLFFGDCLVKNEMTIYLYTDQTIVPHELNKGLDSYINEQYLVNQLDSRKGPHPEKSILSGIDMLRMYSSNEEIIPEVTNQLYDEDTFHQRLCRLIKGKGLTNQEVYKGANLLKKDYQMIMDDPEFKPRMHTTLAFAMALQLTMEQTEDLLKRAGYSFNKKSKLFFLFEYFFNHSYYNIHAVNLFLFCYHFKTMGI